MADIEIKGLKKVYTGGKVGFEDLSLEMGGGEFVVLLGPTGAGKTAVLRTLCGLDDVTEGEIKLGGEVINDRLPKDRNMAVVFKNIGLYPHLNVYDNLAFGLKMRKVAQTEIDKRITFVAKLLGLETMLGKKPKLLSPKDRAKVSLGRAIVRTSDLVLLDDPLSDLDEASKISLRNETLKVYQRLKLNVIYATKDPVEAITLADRIVFMEGGKVIQTGTPEELYLHPATVSVALYIGSPKINLIEGKIVAREEGGNNFAVGDELLKVDKEPRSRVYLAVRPENIVPGGDLKATVRSCEKISDEKYLVSFTFAGDTKAYNMLSDKELSGDVGLSVKEYTLFDARTELPL